MFARTLGPRARRRGIVLILVLGMLGLVALIGVTFATFAGQSLKSSRDFMQGINRPSSEALMDYALAQLINDTSNSLSALRGHSILRDMYGNDSVFRGTNPSLSAAAATHGHLDRVYIGGVPTQLQITNGVTYNTNAGTPFYNQSQFTTNIPTGGQYYGLNFTRWIIKFPPVLNNATFPVAAQTFEILEDDATGTVHVFTLSNNLGNPSQSGSKIPSIDDSTNIYSNPNILPNTARSQIFLNGEYASTFPLTGFTLEGQYMRAFNGPGLTQPDYTGTAVYPANFAAYGNFRLNGIDPDAYGMDEDYDACDLENWYLAIQSADGQVIIPSFHRPGILMATDWTADYNDTSLTAAQRAYNQKAASKILRPRVYDNSPLFPDDPTPDLSTGKIKFDVDNDGDGITDSVWLDLGYPVQRESGGKLYKPLFSFMVLGLNGRLPLNTVGNLQARADGNAMYDNTSYLNFALGTTAPTDPTAPAIKTGELTAVPYPGAVGYPAGASEPYVSQNPLVPAQAYVSQTWVDAPLWDHASHLGYSVNEINPKYALQNAPNNVYQQNDPTGVRHYQGLFPLPYDAATPLPAVTYSQYDTAGMDVALTQLRNLLAGTVPTDQQNPVNAATYVVLNNGDTNLVAANTDVFGTKYYILPNNVLDAGDNGGTGGLNGMARTNGAVPGRWGEPEGIPTAFALNTIYHNYNPSFSIAPYTNPIRAGRSHYGTPSAYGSGSSDPMDDDFDSSDYLFASIPSPAPTYAYPNPPFPTGGQTFTQQFPEEVENYDLAGQRSLPSERIRQFKDPIDPAATGRMVGYMHRPIDAFDRGLGQDQNGRVGFFRYFRPAGLPQLVTYPYPLATSPGLDYNLPLMTPASVDPMKQPATGQTAARSVNSLNGFAQALLPGNLTSDMRAQNVAVMGAMPFNYRNDPAGVNYIPDGYPTQPILAAPSIQSAAPTHIPYISTDWGPNLPVALNLPSYMRQNDSMGNPPSGPAGAYLAASNLGVVNGYLGGSLNKDEADEMNLYEPNLYDKPFGPSDLEWLYRKHDVDGASLTSRLSDLAPISFLNPADGLTRRRLFSTDSWEPISFVYANDNPSGYAHEQKVTYDGNFQPPFQFNSRFAPRASASLYAMNQVANTLNTVGTYTNSFGIYTHANPIATWYIPNPTLPTLPNPNNATTAGVSINSFLPNLGGTALALPTTGDTAMTATSFFDTEPGPYAQPFANSALGQSAVQVQTPALAHRDRRINLNYPLPTSNDPAEPVRQKWVRETYQLLKAILPPQSVDTPEELAALSQYVVNIIDFRDPDCTATRFINTDLETVAADDTNPATVRFARPAVSPQVDPTQPFDPGLYDPDTPTRFLVQHGMESSPIAINEVIGYSITSGGIYNNRLFIELVNTLTNDEGTGGNCNVDLTGWDVVVTPDAYGWGRPDPITGEITNRAMKPVAKSSAVGNPANPPQPPATQPTDAYLHPNSGTGLPGYIIGPANAANPPTIAYSDPMVVAKMPPLGPPSVTAMDNNKPDDTARKFFILANESAATTGKVGSGKGTTPGGETSAVNDLLGTGKHVEGVFPDYVVPYGPFVTASGTDLMYGPRTDMLATGAGRYFWVYLRRPANPFDTAKLTDARPNREMIVVDSMRFRFVEAETGATNEVASAARLQPYRGGHLIRPNTPVGPGGTGSIVDHSPSHAYGFSEQTRPDTTNASKVTTASTKNIEHTLGDKNDTIDDAWANVPFHDRDFTSVAELLLVPGYPPGLFTKQFIEEPYPGNFKCVPYDDRNLTTNSIAKQPDDDSGRKNFAAAAMKTPVPSYPYLPDAFYYSAASVAPPTGPNMAMTKFPTEVGGWTGAGWFKMFEFFEVPSSANGAVGLAANGENFDWYRNDIKPGLMNLNLIIDEEAFFGIIDDERLNRIIAAANYPVGNDGNANYLPSVVTEVDTYGYPAVLQDLTGTTQPILARYPISDLPTVNSGQYGGTVGGFVGRGFVYRDPQLSNTLVHGLKSAFGDFLKLRHGGSGYLFGWGSGQPGSGGYLPTNASLSSFVGASRTVNPSAVASERPFRSLSYPDINYTVMRPASLPPSYYRPGTTSMPSWSYPGIPSLANGDSNVNGNALTVGLDSLLTYGVIATPPYVTLNPAEAPNNLGGNADDGMAMLTGTPFQYVFDPGLKNPYLARQFRRPTPAVILPPSQPNVAPVPPTPMRRLFEIPDVDGSRVGPASKSDASLFGAYDNANQPVDTTHNPYFLTNQPTSDANLTSGDQSAVPPGPNLPTAGLPNSPPSLVNEAIPSNLAATYVPGIVLMPDNQTPDVATRQRLNYLGGNPAIGTNLDNRQHPRYRTEWLQKVMNLTTVRTHQFAVWITIGFFEVVQQGTPELGVPDRLGAELDSAAGDSTRFRSFFVLDRTRAKGFNPYYPGEFRDVVTYRRRIE